MDGEHFGDQQFKGWERRTPGGVNRLPQGREQTPDFVGFADAAGQSVVIEWLPREAAQDRADAFQLFPDAINLDLRRAQIAWQSTSRFARVRRPAAGHLPPDNGIAHLLQALRDSREVVADGAGAADQRVGTWKVLPILERRQHCADGAEGGVDAQLLRLLEQSVAALHQAGGPPCAVRVKRPQARQGIGHHRDCAKVLHGPYDLFAPSTGGMEALVFGQQEVPEAQCGGGVVEAQLAQAQITFKQDVAAEGTTITGLSQSGAGELRVTRIPLVEGKLAWRGGHVGLRVDPSDSRKASRRPVLRWVVASSASRSSTGKPNAARIGCASARHRSQPT